MPLTTFNVLPLKLTLFSVWCWGFMAVFLWKQGVEGELSLFNYGDCVLEQWVTGRIKYCAADPRRYSAICCHCGILSSVQCIFQKKVVVNVKWWTVMHDQSEHEYSTITCTVSKFEKVMYCTRGGMRLFPAYFAIRKTMEVKLPNTARRNRWSW